MKPNNAIYALFTALMLPLLLASCSTTKRLGPDEILYTGVKKVQITGPDDGKLPIVPGAKSAISDAVNVAPNNSLISPYIRYPFPIGLWVYNNWNDPGKGFKHWLYNKLVEEPVLISDVRPELRTKMIDDILDNHGYFRGNASYELVQGKNKKKARILYKVNSGPVYTLDSIYLLPDTCDLYHQIDSVASRSPYLQTGAQYDTDSLSAERIRITNVLRNRGYYFFKPDYIEYLADSTVGPQRIAMKLTVASNTPREALRRYRTGNVTVYINRNQGGGTPETFETPRAKVVQMMPSRLRRGIIGECVTFRKGRYFSVRNMNRTQTYLSRLGIFNAINMVVMPDTVAGSDMLDVAIECTFDTPLEASIEANVSSKSNSYIGPGITLGLTNRNLFGGGEQLNVSLTGSYEWATGGAKGEDKSVFNSYEIGLQASLSFPRLLAPRFVPRTRRYVNWTRITLNADLLNRPHYFKMAQFSTSFNYDWKPTRNTSSTLTLLKLTYTKLLHRTEVFDSIMDANPAVALSFRNQFIPQMAYSYMWQRTFDPDNQLNWQFTVAEAGNIFWAAWRACGVKGEKKLFGMPFSQFVKGTTQLVYSRRLGRGDHWLVTRGAVGAAHAYGNASQVPYSEQFYVGGANSVRAFTVRSLGPGSYRPAQDSSNGYFDQTGTFKFEFNVEYRFPIFGPLHGAVFFDAGNVWLLKNDPMRPGGLLQAKTFLRDLATGTGVGLRFDIGMMVIRGDLGIGIHAPYATSRHGYYNMESFGKSLAFHLAIGYPF